MKEINGIDEKVYRQYEQVRRSGLTNMFDSLKVQFLAEEFGLDELSDIITCGKYVKILDGYKDAVEQGVIER